jgi:hypothetical protein
MPHPSCINPATYILRRTIYGVQGLVLVDDDRARHPRTRNLLPL